MISAMTNDSKLRLASDYTHSDKVSYAQNFHTKFDAAQMRVIRRRREQTPIAATRLFALRKKPADRRRIGGWRTGSPSGDKRAAIQG